MRNSLSLVAVVETNEQQKVPPHIIIGYIRITNIDSLSNSRDLKECSFTKHQPSHELAALKRRSFPSSA
jgi:hypothetical protein